MGGEDNLPGYGDRVQLLPLGRERGKEQLMENNGAYINKPQSRTALCDIQTSSPPLPQITDFRDVMLGCCFRTAEQALQPLRGSSQEESRFASVKYQLGWPLRR